MSEYRSKSFSTASFLEAVARRARVDLVLKPVTPSSQARLISRFLGLRGKEALVLEVPTAKGSKVFVPVGWDVGMLFPVGNFALQARTTVLEHCQYPLHATRRVDGLVVERPRKILSVNRRRYPRTPVDASVAVTASLWPAGPLLRGEGPQAEVGRLRDVSREGLGIQFVAPLAYHVGTEVIVRLEEKGSDQCRILRGALAHCTAAPDGRWVAGLAHVAELGPGEAGEVIESLAAAEPAGPPGRPPRPPGPHGAPGAGAE